MGIRDHHFEADGFCQSAADELNPSTGVFPPRR